MPDTHISGAVTSEQIDELIKQLKISNQIALTTLIKDFAQNPVKCKIEEEAIQWDTLFNEMTALAKHLGIGRSCTDDE